MKLKIAVNIIFILILTTFIWKKNAIVYIIRKNIICPKKLKILFNKLFDITNLVNENKHK